MTTDQLTLFNHYRRHNIDICFFPVWMGEEKLYKFYITSGRRVLWNPTTTNREGRITAYLYQSYEEGLEQALAQAKELLLQ